MNEELIRKYNETISLLQVRKPGYNFYGQFVESEDGKVAYRLCSFKIGEREDTKYKTFKFLSSRNKALLYFIKVAQNGIF